MKKLGSLDVDMPDTHLGLNCSVLLTLHFGSMEIVATAKNETNGASKLVDHARELIEFNEIIVSSKANKVISNQFLDIDIRWDSMFYMLKGIKELEPILVLLTVL
nr:3000_t:CDS:2 [Entrophospora candida]